MRDRCGRSVAADEPDYAEHPEGEHQQDARPGCRNGPQFDRPRVRWGEAGRGERLGCMQPGPVPAVNDHMLPEGALYRWNDVSSTPSEPSSASIATQNRTQYAVQPATRRMTRLRPLLGGI